MKTSRPQPKPHLLTPVAGGVHPVFSAHYDRQLTMTHAEQVKHEKAWKLNDERIRREAAHQKHN